MTSMEKNVNDQGDSRAVVSEGAFATGWIQRDLAAARKACLESPVIMSRFRSPKDRRGDADAFAPGWLQRSFKEAEREVLADPVLRNALKAKRRG